MAEIKISIDNTDKKERLIHLGVDVPLETKEQYRKLRKHFKMTGRDLLRQIIGQVYDQTFEGGK
jgi:hypothetical protein